MNNKRKGIEFEKKICNMFKDRGYWVHFMTPDNRGAQPFDIIAVKNGAARAIECKTLDDKRGIFSISRLEDNQINAFNYWMQKGNGEPFVFIEYDNRIHVIGWMELKRFEKIDLRSGNHIWM